MKKTSIYIGHLIFLDFEGRITTKEKTLLNKLTTEHPEVANLHRFIGKQFWPWVTVERDPEVLRKEAEEIIRISKLPAAMRLCLRLKKRLRALLRRCSASCRSGAKRS